MKRIYKKTLKRVLLSTFIVLFSMVSFSATYYVSSVGNDSNSGLSATLSWKTLAKVNASTFNSGDQILFQKGDTFYGSVTIKNSGSSGSPITFGAYGSGVNPIITGTTTITGWTNEGGGIYSKVISSEAQTNMVIMDGVNTAIGRYPNTVYLNYESYNSNVSITDNQLGSSTIWTGAEAVIRKNDWSLDRCLITNHSGNTLTYTSLGTGWNGTAGNGYFIQNDLRTLDQLGEWYHNATTGKFYMYFGSVDPTTKTVKVATINNIINNTGARYVAIQNLSLIGCINNGINMGSTASDNVSVKNCTISFAGATGIATSGPNNTFDSNVISDCNSNGIVTSNSNQAITNNTISNIGIVKGSSKYYSQGIVADHINNVLIQYNKIENIGYNGMFIHGNSITVKNNFINNTCLVLNDGGGIYTDDIAPTAMLIDGNIVLNSLGNMEGGETPLKISEGIYLDEFASNITVQNNTVANCAYSGIKLHKAHDNIIQNNTCYGNYTGIYLLNSSTTNSPMVNNRILSNIFVATTWDKHSMFIRDTYNTSPVYGTSNNNYFIKLPSDPYNPILTSLKGVGVYKTLSQWQVNTGQDAASHESPETILSNSDLQLEYNATQSAKTVTLSKPMIDVKGTKYPSTVTLQPYTSVVLIKDYSTTTVLPIVYNVTGGGSYTSGGSSVAVGLSGSQTGVNYQLKLDGVNTGSVVSGTGSVLSFGNKTAAGIYTVTATLVSAGSTVNMTGSATITANQTTIGLTGASVSPTTASISVGLTQQLTASVSPTNATNKIVSWSSSNTSVVSVNSLGLVTGVAAGSATITVTTQDGAKTAASTITVSNSSTVSTIGLNTIGGLSESGDNNYWIANSFTPVSNMTVNRINLYVTSASGKARLGIYSSLSGEPGTLLAQTGEISLTNGWNSGILGSTQNLVPGATYWLAFEVSSSATTLKYNQATGRMRYKSFTYGSLPSAAPLSTSLGTGIYSIYADNSGIIASNLVTGVTLNPTTASISVGLTQQLAVSVSPTNATNKIVSWSSSNPSVVSVNSLGLVTGVAAGSATITVTTQDGAKTAACAITVSNSSTVSTIGLNTVGGISEYGDNNYWIANSFTPVSSMTVNRINLYVSSASGKARLGIYSSLSGEPGTLLAQTGEISLTTGWNSGILGSTQNLVPGATYWLAFELSSSATTVKYNQATGRMRYKSFTYGSLPTAAPLSTSLGSGIYSIYADNNLLKSGYVNENTMTTGIDDVTDLVKIDVFPNPSKGKVTIRFSELPAVGSRIDIVDLSGRRITSRLITGTSEELNLDQQPSGIYLVKTILGSREIIHKLILNK